jgi:hypothetical protein
MGSSHVPVALILSIVGALSVATTTMELEAR